MIKPSVRGLLFGFIIFTLNPAIAHCQFILTVEINSVLNNNGRILFLLLDKDRCVVKEISSVIVQNKCKIVIKELEKGEYAFKFFHDENVNKKLDKNWLGVPLEGYGFSNFENGPYIPPSFSEMIFEVTSDMTVNCTPVYINLF